jgi:hypothetical protein
VHRRIVLARTTKILSTTSITAIFAGLLILSLTAKVIQLRRRDGVVLGDNDNRTLTKEIRGHANATEQFPIALILMGLAEAQGGSTGFLAAFAACLVVGRLLHAVYFAMHGTHWRLRQLGMLLTLLAQAGLVAMLAVRVI